MHVVKLGCCNHFWLETAGSDTQAGRSAQLQLLEPAKTQSHGLILLPDFS
jgi:hypothetical protein